MEVITSVFPTLTTHSAVTYHGTPSKSRPLCRWSPSPAEALSSPPSFSRLSGDWLGGPRRPVPLPFPWAEKGIVAESDCHFRPFRRIESSCDEQAKEQLRVPIQVADSGFEESGQYHMR